MPRASPCSFDGECSRAEVRALRHQALRRVSRLLEEWWSVHTREHSGTVVDEQLVRFSQGNVSTKQISGISELFPVDSVLQLWYQEIPIASYSITWPRLPSHHMMSGRLVRGPFALAALREREKHANRKTYVFSHSPVCYAEPAIS